MLSSSKRLVRQTLDSGALQEPWQPWTALAMRSEEHALRSADHLRRPCHRLALNDTLRVSGPETKANSEFAKGDTVAPGAVVLRSVLQNCRGVPFKGPRSLGGSRLKGPSKDRGVQGGRGEGGKVNLPPYKCLIHADGSANFIRPKGPCGTHFYPKTQSKYAYAHAADPVSSLR